MKVKAIERAKVPNLQEIRDDAELPRLHPVSLSQGSHIKWTTYQIFTLLFITVAKLVMK